MTMLVIYDNDGFILAQAGEFAREPVGVPFMWVDVPQGKYVVSVDTTSTPHKAIFEDLPLSEIDILRLEQAQTNAELEFTNMLIDFLNEDMINFMERVNNDIIDRLPKES